MRLRLPKFTRDPQQNRMLVMLAVFFGTFILGAITRPFLGGAISFGIQLSGIIVMILQIIIGAKIASLNANDGHSAIKIINITRAQEDDFFYDKRPESITIWDTGVKVWEFNELEQKMEQVERYVARILCVEGKPLELGETLGPEPRPYQETGLAQVADFEFTRGWEENLDRQKWLMYWGGELVAHGDTSIMVVAEVPGGTYDRVFGLIPYFKVLWSSGKIKQTIWTNKRSNKEKEQLRKQVQQQMMQIQGVQ